MNDRTTCLLYPGSQQDVGGGELSEAAQDPQVRQLLARGAEIAAEVGLAPITSTLVDGPASSAARPGERYLRLGVVSLAAATLAPSHGGRLFVHMGHSLGEWWALGAAGAFSAADTLRLACWRAQAEERSASGAMAAVSIGFDQARHLVAALSEPQLTVACDNAPDQVVLAGPPESIDRAKAVVEAAGWQMIGLDSLYGYHSVLMAAASEEFRATAEGVRQRPLQSQVYSPTAGRYLTDDDDLIDHLAWSMVRPVRFVGALRAVHGAGVSRFIQCGVGRALLSFASATIPAIHTETAGIVVGQRGAAHLAATSAQQPTSPVPVRAPEPAADGTRAGTDRSTVVRDLTELYASVLEYPVELVTEDAELEADLGVDSLKQVEILARVAQQYGVPELAKDVRLLELSNIGHVADAIVGRK